MASIYEKKLFFVIQHHWDTKTVLPKIYKLQSNDPRNKYKAEIHKDGGLLGVEFTLDKTISEFIHALEKLNLDYVTSFVEFGNVLLGCYQADWKQVLHERFPEPVNTEVVRPAQDCALAENFSRAIDLFLTCTLNKKNRDRQYIYLAPGRDHGIHKDLLTSPLDHLHHFEEMLCITKLLPEGDIPEPNATLQVQWFYMSFHCSNHVEYIRSGRKLSNETIQTLAKYFESIFLGRLSNGSIQRKHDEQLCAAAKRELRHELEERYRIKLKRLSESQEHYASRKYRGERVSRPTFYSDRRHLEARCSGYRDSRQDRQDCQDCKAPLKDGKFKKPCHLHGVNSMHSYDEYRLNPKNQVCNNNINNYIKKQAHDVHYHDGRRHGSRGKLLASCTSAAPSNNELSVNKSGGNRTPENYHLDSFHIPKKRKVGNVGTSPQKIMHLWSGVFLRIWMPSSTMTSLWTCSSMPFKKTLVCPCAMTMTRLILRIDGPRQWKLVLSTIPF
jgi:hypothetical protein